MTSENEHPAAKEQPYPIDEPTASRRIAEAAVADTVTGAMADPIELTITPAAEQAMISQEQGVQLLEEYARRLVRAGLTYVERVLGRWPGDRLEVWTVVDEADWDQRRAIYDIEISMMDVDPEALMGFKICRRRGMDIRRLVGSLSQYTIIELGSGDANKGRASEMASTQSGDAGRDR